MRGFWAALLLIAGAAALAIALLLGVSLRRTMMRLGDLVDNAIAGEVEPGRIDESKLSQLESKLRRFVVAGKLSKAALAEEKRDVQSLISDISHQMKTPLAGTILYTGLLREQPNLPEAAQELLLQIEAQNGKLHFLVDALIKASRLESGLIGIVPLHCDACELLEGLARAAAPQAAAKGITMHVDPGSSGVPVFCDPKWTSEAVGNLLDNALKYTPQGGSVALSAKPGEMFAELTVADNGPGIAESEQPLVFRRFYRSPQTHQQEGVGLGLFLARKIAQAQGGYIRLESVAGGGSRFALLLPVPSYADADADAEILHNR